MSEPSDNLNQKQQARLFTPLEDGALLLRKFEGTEQISRLFKFSFELYCPTEKKTQIEFEKLLGKEFSIECDIYDRTKEERTEEFRYFSGICFSVTQGLQDYDFTSFIVEIVPKVQLLTLQARSRIFQQKTVLDILKEVLPKSGVEYQVTGNFEKREYCVQYRETDFDFASRLMEEEGIFYYFKYEKLSHTMVLLNEAAKHPKVKKPDTIDLDPTEGGNRRAAHASAWAKMQRLKTGKYTLWDHHFQLPTANLEAKKTTQESAKVGKVDHKLKVGGNENLEIYDFPGGYAKRVDGINKSGGEQPSELQTVHTDNQRTVKLRMEAETTQAVLIHGESNCVNFITGHKFTIEESDASKDFKGDGDYVHGDEARDRDGGWLSQRRAGTVCLREQVRLRPVCHPLPAAANHAQADGHGRAKRDRGWSLRRGNFHGQIRARKSTVSLGPRGQE
jgi:type VI secretion system secreted protein VgrG